MADIQDRMSKIKSSTAPGPDMIHANWMKKLTGLHKRLGAQMNHLLRDGSHSEWLSQERTVLIQKDPHKGPIPSNYQPITFLNTTKKALSSIIAAKISKHVAQYMRAQKGIGSNTRGTNHQLLVNRAVAWDCKNQPILIPAWQFVTGLNVSYWPRRLPSTSTTLPSTHFGFWLKCKPVWHALGSDSNVNLVTAIWDSEQRLQL